MHPTLASLLAISVVALLAPLLSDTLCRRRVPAVVVEILLGIAIGPQLLGLASVDATIETLSRFGLAFLFFMAGFEIDFARIRGRPLWLALAGWLISLLLAMAVARTMAAAGLSSAPLYIGLALTTTAIGTLMPILRDGHELDTRFGTYILAAGAVGEFVPILAIALLLNPDQGEMVGAGQLVLYAAILVVVALLAGRRQPGPVVRLLARTLRSSDQWAVRLSIVLLIGLASLAQAFSIEFLLGAFAAGVIAGRLFDVALQVRPHHIDVVRAKYEGIAFGFLVPIFFVASGMQFDLAALWRDPLSLALLPLFVVLFLVVRGLPALLLYRGTLGAGERLPLALMASTQLPLVIAITDLGVDRKLLEPSLATAMVGAGMLSVLLLPPLALQLRRQRPATEAAEA
ncbi:MAG: cation:proton antiporter [Geminicoccaceae bacterium]